MARHVLKLRDRAAGQYKGLFFWSAIGLALLIAPHLLYPEFMMKLLCFALVAAAFNLLIGYVGLLSFGHAAFFGGGAYITAHAVKVWGVPPEIGVLLGGLTAGLLGWLFGVLAIRRKGIYFSMITLALSQMVFFIALQVPFTGGEDGIQSVPRGHLFGLIDLNQSLTMYYFVLAIFVFSLAAIWRVVHSPFGRILLSIRENEARAISLGYDVDRYKIIAFVVSASFAGIAGGTKSIVFQLASLTDISWPMSGEIILMTLLGGIGTFLGPVLGGFLVIGLQDTLASSGFPVPVLIGAIFMACVLLFRRGIVGEIEAWLRGRSPRP